MNMMKKETMRIVNKGDELVLKSKLTEILSNLKPYRSICIIWSALNLGKKQFDWDNIFKQFKSVLL